MVNGIVFVLEALYKGLIPNWKKHYIHFCKSYTLCLKKIQASTFEIFLAQVYGQIALIKTELCSTLEGPVQARNSTWPLLA